MESLLDDLIPWLGALVFVALVLFPKPVYRADRPDSADPPKRPAVEGDGGEPPTHT